MKSALSWSMILFLLTAMDVRAEVFTLMDLRVVRGTLMEPVRGNKLKLLDSDGKEHEFTVTRNTEYREGTRGQRFTNDSHLRAGTLLLVQAWDNGVATEVVTMYRWHEYPAQWLEDFAFAVQAWSRETLGTGAFLSEYNFVLALMSISLVSLICGMVSSLVVSNRMAFFSDALAHCAFAGVGLGLILYMLGLTGEEGILGMMIVFGILVGLAIAYVREQTSLASDTVIGVFFAGAMGFGAVLLKALSGRTSFNPENFVFGEALAASGQNLVYFILLLIGLTVVLCWLYNRMVFTSFNPSLARSRNFPVRLASYLFIVLLALVVNISLKLVGALLINALLILPAATASNLSRNLRQFFWLSVILSVATGVGGLLFSYWLVLSRAVHVGTGGMIVVVSVVLFFVSMVLGRWIRGSRASLRTGF